jgi:hypothetical protein
MKLKQLASNMTELQIGSTHILFSYETPVAILHDEQFYRTSKKWSVTTSKHIGKWSNLFWNVPFSDWQEKPQEWFDEFINSLAGFAPDRISHPELFKKAA